MEALPQARTYLSDDPSLNIIANRAFKVAVIVYGVFLAAVSAGALYIRYGMDEERHSRDSGVSIKRMDELYRIQESVADDIDGCVLSGAGKTEFCNLR